MRVRGIRVSVTALTLAIALLAMLACGNDTTSSGVTPAADVPTATPVAKVEGASRMSVDDYLLAVCGETEVGAWEEGTSLRELASGLETITEYMGVLAPPAELSDWHDAQLAFQRTYKQTIDNYLNDPQGRSEDEFLLSMFSTLAPHFQPIEQAIAGMPPDLRARMVAAGCIDDEPADAAPLEDTAPTAVEREEIFAGVSVTGALDEPDERDRFRFDAEAGQTYLFEVAWQDLPSMELSIFMPPGFNWGYRSEISPIVAKWTPEVSGTYDITISSEGAGGSYTLSVSLSGAPDTPANARYAWEGAGITVSWDPVEGADYYNVYYSDFFDSGCTVDVRGNLRWCDEIATNVTATTFGHMDPDVAENHYWVVACNSDGCSDTDPDTPAQLIGDGSGGPTTGSPCRAGTELAAGDSCSVVIPGVDATDGLFEVRGGEGCYGDTCSDDVLVLNGFFANLVPHSGSWLITRVPDVTSNDPAPTPMPAAAPTPTAAQPEETSRLSLEDYMAFCGGPGYELGGWEENSLREVAAGWGTIVDHLASVQPPEEVTGWHRATLAFLRAVKASVDAYIGSGGGQSEDDYLLTVLFPLALQYQPQIEHATSGMDPAVRAQMVAAGCIE